MYAIGNHSRSHFVGPEDASMVGSRIGVDADLLDCGHSSLIKAGCDMATETHTTTTLRATKSRLRRQLRFLSPLQFHTVQLVKNGCDMIDEHGHNHFYEQAATEALCCGAIRRCCLSKPTTSKWLWYERINISPPLWQARPEKRHAILALVQPCCDDRMLLRMGPCSSKLAVIVTYWSMTNRLWWQGHIAFSLKLTRNNTIYRLVSLTSG